MADIETYGGSCPKCSKSMLQKGDTGCGTWFSYDACIWCGFAYGTVDGNKEYKAGELWDSILEHYDAKDRKDLLLKLDFSEHVPEEESDFYPAVFNYSNQFLEYIRKLNE